VAAFRTISFTAKQKNHPQCCDKNNKMKENKNKMVLSLLFNLNLAKVITNKCKFGRSPTFYHTWMIFAWYFFNLEVCDNPF